MTILDLFIPHSFTPWGIGAFVVLTVWRLFLCFAVLYKVRQAVAGKPAERFVRPLLYIGFAAGYVYDVVSNWTVGSLLFWDRPGSWKQTISMRMTGYIKGGYLVGKSSTRLEQWRFRLSYEICEQLERIDPGHCRLQHNPEAALRMLQGRG